MLRFFRKRKLQEYVNGAEAYIQKTYKPYRPFPDMRFSIAEPDEDCLESGYREEV